MAHKELGPLTGESMSREYSFGRALLIMAATTCVTCAACAQSLGDVARTERARRAQLKSHTYVITNEDLKRDQILQGKPMWPAVDPNTEVATEGVPVPVHQGDPPGVVLAPEVSLSRTGVHEMFAPQVSAPQVVPEMVSLGEYARAIRAQRALRDAQRAKQLFEARVGAPAPVYVEAQPPAIQVATKKRKARTPDTKAPNFQFAFSWPKLPQQKASASLSTPRTVEHFANPKASSERQLVKQESPVVHVRAAKAKPATRVAVQKTVQSRVQNTVQQSEVRTHKQTTARALFPKLAPRTSTSLARRQATTSLPAASQKDSVKLSTVQVQRGESLWILARKHLGSGKLWTKIWEANPQLRNPNIIRAGMQLALPLSDVDTHVASRDKRNVKRASINKGQAAEILLAAVLAIMDQRS